MRKATCLGRAISEDAVDVIHVRSQFGATLAGAGINIATFHLGRAEQGGDAICLVSVDEPVPEVREGRPDLDRYTLNERRELAMCRWALLAMERGGRLKLARQVVDLLLPEPQ